jgi:rare lipoprotein A
VKVGVDHHGESRTRVGKPCAASGNVAAMRFAWPAPSASRLCSALALAAFLCGCASPPPRGGDGPGANPPADLASLADAEPRIEPVRPGGANKPYQVLGRDYVPSTRDAPFSERGLASWYGRKFHGRRTASGEVYDMYAMTAAHPTLPIPSYARIRNPANGREVLVRINDRGPFHAGRIVDLSYAAALKLDLLRGVAPVELERITFEEIRTGAWRSGAGATRLASAAAAVEPAAAPTAVVPVPAADVAFVATAPPAPSGEAPALSVRPASEAARGFWVQLGAFRERDGAESFQRRVGADNEAGWLAPLLAVFGDSTFFRVQAGPYPSRDEADGAAQRVRASLGIVPLIVERR